MVLAFNPMINREMKEKMQKNICTVRALKRKAKASKKALG